MRENEKEKIICLIVGMFEHVFVSRFVFFFGLVAFCKSAAVEMGGKLPGYRWKGKGG